jgi:hypothetical protein
LWCLAVGLSFVAPASWAQEPASDLRQLHAVAESIVAREEAASDRLFDSAFRGKAKQLLAALPLAELLAQTGEAGLGLNSLGDSQADLVYTPLTPCRIVDTRLDGGPIGAGTTRSFLVTGTDYSAQGGSAAGCGVPYGPTTAAAINFVAVDPTGLGNLQLTPYGSALPTASIINYRAGANLANGLVVAICNPSSATCTSDVTIKANVSATGLVADVQGYFRRVATGGVGTALLADSAVTAPKISSGVVVRSLNSQTDSVTLAGSNGLGVTQASGTVTVTSNAAAANTPSAIVARDGSGNFSAGTITVAGNLMLPSTTASTGMIRLGGDPFLHRFGTENTFVGTNAGNTGTTGGHNSAVGYGALQGNTNSFNTAVGAETLFVNTTGWGNTAAGFQALYSNEGGFYNTAAGMDALFHNTGGMNNTAVGRDALLSNTTGSRNIAIGWGAGTNATTGDDNIFIGYPGVAGDGHTIHIGTYNSQYSFFAEGIYQSSINDRQVFINSAGQLGTLISSRSYKDEIRDMGDASDGLMRLRPVSFRYKQPEPSGERPLQFGLIAEEVAEVYPELVARSESGEPRSVRYHLLGSMLLNELQKQRRLLEEQRSENETLSATIRDLEARLESLEAAAGTTPRPSAGGQPGHAKNGSAGAVDLVLDVNGYFE